MTAAFLQSELTSLIADSKKRSSEVRSAAEKSLTDLKSIPVTSELQLGADLQKLPDFIDPFVLACRAKNAKLANHAAAGLQRLVASRAVPKQRLGDVLTACQDVASIGYDVQLKILQTLPALLQLYSTDVHGQLLAELLDLCASLQSSRTELVSSTAGATLEQLIASVFEEASKESHQTTANGKDHTAISDDAGRRTSTAADDASRIFEDFCAILNQSEPTFLKTKHLPTVYILDALEHIIRDHSAYLKTRPHLLEACRTQLIPSLQDLLLTKDDFYLYLHVCRMCWVLLIRLLSVTQDVIPILSSILIFAERDKGPLWKRVLSLELYEKVCSNIGALLRIAEGSEGVNSSVITDLMAMLVRIAAEDPTLIGLGRQSTMPMQRGHDAGEDEMASIEAQGIGGGLASVNSADANVTGISIHFSAMETSLMDDGESMNLSSIPKTYLYTLVLGCMSSFCEGLSKFVMPLSVTRRHVEELAASEDDDTEDGGADEGPNSKTRRRAVQSQKYQRLSNPLKIKNLTQLPQLQACSDMIDTCWPAILATCSTFLNAALDSHFYHVLIRSMQKLAQVSGTLEMSTPRDALLTSLAKGSVPAYATAILTAAQKRNTRDDEEPQDAYAESVRSPRQETGRQSIDIKSHGLNVRHLLCLRALLNLGIALGPTLSEDSWFILIETLQQDEALMALATARRSTSTPSIGGPEADMKGSQSSLAGEMSAVNTAAKRMFDSTRSYPDERFASVTKALFRLMGENHENTLAESTTAGAQSPATLASPTPDGRKHRPSRSVSGLWAKTRALDLEVAFALAKINELARSNIHRFVSTQSNSVSWDLLVKRLLDAFRDNAIEFERRLQAAQIVDTIAVESVKLLKSETHSQEEISTVQQASLEALLAQIRLLFDTSQISDNDAAFIMENRKRIFEALEDILGQCGDTLEARWHLVFQVLQHSFAEPEHHWNGNNPTLSKATYEYTSYTPLAFRCIQLICNDFMQNLDPATLDQLIALLHHFGAQSHDLNMALTTTSLIRNTVSLSQTKIDVIDLSQAQEASTAKTDPPYLTHETMKTWFHGLQQLVAQCKDQRQEVRDASVRILLQVLDSASEKIAVESWFPVLSAGPLSILSFYGEVRDAPGMQLSIRHLVENTVKLLDQNIQHIASARNFPKVWSKILNTFDGLLGDSPLALHGLVFSSIAQLLVALRNTGIETGGSVMSVLHLWTSRTIPVNDVSEQTEANQAALDAYMRTFVEASRSEQEVLQIASSADSDVYQHIKDAIRTAFLDATHPQYTSDVKKMSPEQESACEVLAVLRLMSTNRLSDYSDFVLKLIQAMLSTYEGPQPTPTPKRAQKPKFIAVCSRLFVMFRELVVEQEHNSNLVTDLHLHIALQQMSNAINTKYSNIPINADAPLWREATTTAVVIVKAAQSSHSLPPELLANLNTSIVSCLASILGSGGLSPNLNTIPPTNIISDQSFDIASFQSFHASSFFLLSQPSTDALLRKQYILTIFHASLLAKPWYFDFPSDLLVNPLSDLSTIRAGSVHNPIFTPRPSVAYAALDALFAFIDPQNLTFSPTMTAAAVPYLILRVSHSLKTFMADQPLRGLTPLPHPYRVELKYVLEMCLKAPCDDAAVATALGKQQMLVTGDGDGKSLLRVLYGMVLRFRNSWETRVMRLGKGEGAWQDEEEGKAIEEAVKRWCEGVGEGWGVG